MAHTPKVYSAVTLRETVTVYTSRDRINVIIPGTGPEGEGNHFFPRHGGPIGPQIMSCVDAVIRWETDVAKIRASLRYISPTIGRGPDGFGLHSEWLRYAVGTPSSDQRGKWTVRMWDVVPAAEGEYGYTL